MKDTHAQYYRILKQVVPFGMNQSDDGMHCRGALQFSDARLLLVTSGSNQTLKSLYNEQWLTNTTSINT